MLMSQTGFLTKEVARCVFLPFSHDKNTSDVLDRIISHVLLSCLSHVVFIVFRQGGWWAWRA